MVKCWTNRPANPSVLLYLTTTLIRLKTRVLRAPTLKTAATKIILPYGKAYGFLAEKTNFLAESDNIDLTTIKEYTEIERDLYLSPIEIGKTITLNNVFFVRSKADLLPGSFSELDRLVKVLTDNPRLKN